MEREDEVKLALIDKCVKDLEKSVEKIENTLSNGIKEFISRTTEKLSLMYKDQERVERSIDELDKRVTSLEISSSAISAKQSFVIIVIVTIVTAAINFLFKK